MVNITHRLPPPLLPPPPLCRHQSERYSSKSHGPLALPSSSTLGFEIVRTKTVIFKNGNLVAKMQERVVETRNMYPARTLSKTLENSLYNEKTNLSL
jgi:hypothetical protein